MLVEIYSDIVCPWCAIGKARFEKAVDSLPEERRSRVTVIYRPHQLDPTAPSSPTPVFDAYAKKFGGADKAAQIIERVTHVAAEEGLTFRMDIGQRANTFDAHRLVAEALDRGGTALQHTMKQVLLDAYFTRGLDVGSHQVLATLAVESGVHADAPSAMEFLSSTAQVRETRESLGSGVENGVTAVPTFVFDGRWSIPGAQDTEVFAKVLERMLNIEDEEQAIAES